MTYTDGTYADIISCCVVMPTSSHYPLLSIWPNIHIKIPPTGYRGIILCSTDVATASHSTIESTMRVLCSYACVAASQSFLTVASESGLVFKFVRLCVIDP